MENRLNEELKLAEIIREACLQSAREGFQDASLSGLCSDGAIEAAISAIQKLNLEKIINQNREKAHKTTIQVFSDHT